MDATPLGLRIARAAEGWVGTPYAVGGRDRHGVDCIGLLVVVAHELGLSTYDPGNYAEGDGPARLRAGLAAFCDVVDGPPLPGDILLLSRRGAESHLALVASDGGLIHARNAPSVRRVVHHPPAATGRAPVTAHFRWKEGRRG